MYIVGSWKGSRSAVSTEQVLTVVRQDDSSDQLPVFQSGTCDPAVQLTEYPYLPWRALPAAQIFTAEIFCGW